MQVTIQQTQMKTINLDHVTCDRCGRELTALKSIAVGMGKRCEELNRIEKAKAAAPKTERKLVLTTRKQKSILNFVKKYIKPQTSLFRVTHEEFNYVWGLEYNNYYQNSYYYNRYESNNLEKLIKTIDTSF